MSHPDDISELDLLAYADGRLDAQRAREVEARLDRDPELRRMVTDFAQQNAELHAVFDRYAEQPPPAVSSVLSGGAAPRSSRRAGVVRAMAATVLMAMTGVAGWWLGTLKHGEESGAVASFIDQAAAFSSEDDSMATELAARSGKLSALAWFSDSVSLELSIPDLSAEGYSLVDKRRMRFNGREGVVLRYSGPNGHAIDVFLRTRWTKDRSDYRIVQKDDMTVAYWLEGPFAVAITGGQAATGELEQIAERVRRALAGDEAAPPKLLPDPKTPKGPQEAGASAYETQQKPATSQPAAPEPATLPNSQL